jgi:hypothetical protein
LPSRPEPVEPKVTRPVDVRSIVVRMATSIGQEKAAALVVSCLNELGLPIFGALDANSADRLLDRLAAEPGLVGIAAKATKMKLATGA